MISFFRTLFDSWLGRFVALGFIVLIGFAFALADVSGNLSGGATGGGAVAEVGQLEVPMADYALAIDSDYRRIRQQNPDLDMRSFVRGGGAESVFERLVASYAVAAFARENGITVSQAMVDSKIAELPAAIGADGKFDAEAYRAFLADAGLTDDQLRDDFRRSFLTEQLLPLASYGAQPPKSLISRYAAINFETRKGLIAALPSIAFVPKTEPGKSDLAKFYAENSDRFTIPERRAIAYAVFSRDIVGEAGRPTDAEIAAYYKDNRDEFAAAKTVRYEQLVVPSRAEAQQVVEQIEKGQSLAAVGDKLGFSVTEQSADRKEKLAENAGRAVADAVYGAAEGEMTQPAEGEFGFVVARIKSIEEQPARTMAEAHDDIYALLEDQKSADALVEITNDMQGRLEEGESLASVAKSYDLTVKETPAVIERGIDPKNTSYQVPMSVKGLLPIAFQMDRADPARLTEMGKNRYALLGVKQVEPAAPPPLSEIRDQVVAAWKIEKGAAAAKKAGETVLAKMKDGSSLAQAVASLDTRLPRPQRLSGTRQELAEQGEKVPAAMFAMFQIPEGKTRLVPVGQDRGYLLIQVEDVVPADIGADDERLPEFVRQYGNSLQEELQRQFIAALRKDVGVKVNEDKRRAVIDQLTGAN